MKELKPTDKQSGVFAHEVTKAATAKSFLNKETVEADTRLLAACQMCIYAALKIGGACSDDILYIIDKYKSKAHELKTLIKGFRTFAHNTSERLARLKDGGGVVDKSREQATALSAAAFIDLYMAAVAIMPSQLDDFCRDVYKIAYGYSKQPNASPDFRFIAWLGQQGFKFDMARYWKENSPYTVTFIRRGDEELMQICKGVEMPCYTGGIPALEYEAEALFVLLKIIPREQ